MAVCFLVRSLCMFGFSLVAFLAAVCICCKSLDDWERLSHGHCQCLKPEILLSLCSNFSPIMRRVWVLDMGCFWAFHEWCGPKVHRSTDLNAKSNECIRQFSWVWLRRLSCTRWELYCRLHSGRTAQCWQSTVATRAEHLLLIDVHRSSSQEVELNCRFLVFVEDVYWFLIFLEFSWQTKLEFPRWLNMSKCVRLERIRMKLYVVWENNLCSFGCIELPTLKIIFDDQFEPKEKPQSSVHPWPWVESQSWGDLPIQLQWQQRHRHRHGHRE